MEVAVADQSKFYDQSVTQAKQEEGAITPSHLTGISANSLKLSLEEAKEKQNEKRPPTLSKSPKSSKTTCWKYGPSKVYFENYNGDRQNVSQKGAKRLQTVSTCFTEASDYNTYCLIKQSQEYNGHIFRNSTKRAKRMDRQMKLTVMKPLNAFSTLSFLQNMK